MSTPTATPRTQSLWMKHHAFSTEEEATEALCDFRDHGNALETELACEKTNRNHLIEKGAKLETELAAAQQEAAHYMSVAQKATDELARFRAEVERLKKQIKDDNRSYGCELRDPNGTIWEQAAKDHARAERAEAELANIRALADRRNKRYHVEDTTHQLVAALDQALDIAQAELAAERARLDWVFHNCKVTADGYATGNREVYAVHDREDLGAAMKEGAK